MNCLQKLLFFCWQHSVQFRSNYSVKAKDHWTIGDVGDFGSEYQGANKMKLWHVFLPPQTHLASFNNLETAFVCCCFSVTHPSQPAIHGCEIVTTFLGLSLELFWFTAAVGMFQILNLDTSELFPIVRTIVKQCQVDKNHSRSLNGRSWEIWSTGVKFVGGFCYRIYRTSNYANVSDMFWLVFVLADVYSCLAWTANAKGETIAKQQSFAVF